jgi:acyl-CoA dehydrogenase
LVGVTIDYSVPPEVADIRDRVVEFVAEVVVPREPEARSAAGPGEELRLELQAEARRRGLLSPAAGTEWGGLGLDLRGCAPVFEAAGYSPLGPLALNCAAPDEGNMHLLEVVATPEQQHRFLAPLVKGETRSAFAMTEPAPGAGSDPAALLTMATADGEAWIINGRKWFISGADGAAFYICMARTSGGAADAGGGGAGGLGATMFLVDASNPGVRIERRIGTLDHSFAGGHCEVIFEDCQVGPEAVLGEVGKGFEYAQVRLNPARMTHCMRWLGSARRAHDTALDYVSRRELFGQPLGSLGLAQQHIADNEIDMAATRALTWQAAWALDQGQAANMEVGIAKVFSAEAIFRVVDRSMQLCGAYGVSDDSVLGWLFREVRPFRIYDGASEVHRMSIAKRVVRRAQGHDSGTANASTDGAGR